jgi:hypothetical protein
VDFSGTAIFRHTVALTGAVWFLFERSKYERKFYEGRTSPAADNFNGAAHGYINDGKLFI